MSQVQLPPSQQNLPIGSPDEPEHIEGKTPPKDTIKQDVQGTPGGKTPPATPRPFLPPPSLSPSAMMIALTALQAKMAEQGIQFGEKSMDGVRDDIKKNGDKRAEELKTYFKNLDKSLQKKCGLFGAIIKFFKAVFTGDMKGIKEAFSDLGSIIKDIAKIVVVALAVVAAAAATAVSAGAGAGLMALAIVGAVLVLGSMALSDPGIMEMILNALPEDQRQAVAIVLAVVSAVLAIAGSIMTGAATGGGATLAAISKVATVISDLISAGVTIEQGVKSHQAAGHRADSQRSLAEIDIMDARMTDLKGVLERSQRDLKTMFEAFAKALESTKDMISTYGQNQARAASV